jgi:hypothetical protein
VSATVAALLLALAACGKPAPPPPAPAPIDTASADALRRDLDTARAELAELQRRRDDMRREADTLRQTLQETSDERQRLREALAMRRPIGTLSESAVRVRIAGVDGQSGVVMLERGRKHGVRAGDRYDVYRKSDGERIAVIEVEKFAGLHDEYSKCRVIEGRAAEIARGDEAIDPRGAEPRRPGSHAVVNKISASALVDYGSAHGATPGERVTVLRRGRRVGELRLDTVGETFSVGQPVDGEFAVGDEIAKK